MIRISDPAQLGAALDEIRQLLGITQRDLARLVADQTDRDAETVRGQLSSWAVGRNSPSAKSLAPVLAALGYDLALIPRTTPVEVGHLIVAEAGATTCCGRQPLELPDGHWLTEDRGDATCPALAPRENA